MTKAPKRVGIIAIQHESNTFSPQETALHHFEEKWLLRGNAIRPVLIHAHHEVSGFIEGLDTTGIEAVPLLVAKANPHGTVAAGVLEQLLEMALEELAGAGHLDGLLVAPHGAGVSQSQTDMDGYWLTAIRDKVGPELPIICTLDPHANISPAMIAACNATIAYRTNPHLDQKQRGLEAASLMARTLHGEISPVQFAVWPNVAINIERQLTSSEPCATLYRYAEEIAQHPEVLSTSIILGFPYADVPKMGSALIVVTDNNPELAKEQATLLGEELWNRREVFRGQMISCDEAVARAAESPKPVCLLDMGDNVGGGSPGDGTFLAQALISRPQLRGLVALCDPESVQQAKQAGIGAEVNLRVGGKIDHQHGTPIALTGIVKNLTDGKFHDSEARHGGAVDYNVGPTAVIETSHHGTTFILTTDKPCTFSLGQVLSCGLYPKGFDVIAVKGVHAPVAAYAPVCPAFIRVNTPGITCADMEQLTYHHRSKPLYPFEEGKQDA